MRLIVTLGCVAALAACGLRTPASELARLAAEARPGLLVLYHGLYYGVPEATVVDALQADYDGDVVLADDLDVF